MAKIQNEFVSQIKIAAFTIIMLTILTGVIYPALITVVAQLVFPHQANGSIIQIAGKKFGSKLIGQPFSDPKYFWGRISTTTLYPYNALSSGGSNLGPLNQDLLASVKSAVSNFSVYQPSGMQKIPVDLVTSSGSGLDPEITPYSAFFQIARIAKNRNMLEDEIKLLVEKSIEGRLIGVFGEPRVNVLELNLKLDELSSGDNK